MNLDDVKKAVLQGIVDVQLTIVRFKEDPNYIATPFGMLNFLLLVMGGWSLFVIIVSTLFSYEVDTGFTTYALSWIYFVYSACAGRVFNKEQNPMLVGLVLGAGIALCLVSLAQAYHFHSLTHCVEVKEAVDQWSCTPSLKSQLSNTSLYLGCYAAMLGGLVVLAYTKMQVILSEGGQYVEVGGGLGGGLDGLEDTPLTYGKGPPVAL
jgi:hypothetical protein